MRVWISRWPQNFAGWPAPCARRLHAEGGWRPAASEAGGLNVCDGWETDVLLLTARTLDLPLQILEDQA